MHNLKCLCVEVWIEQVLIDNFIINFLIIFSTLKLLKMNVYKWKIILSALIGAIFSLFLPLIHIHSLLLIILKLLIGLLMILLLFRLKEKPHYKNILLCFLTFLLMTFLFGGVCYGIILLLNINFLGNSISVIYNYDFPISLIVVICFLTFYLLLKIIMQIYKKKNVQNFVYKIIFSHKNRIIETTAFFDSGNKLIDEQSNKPIIIISLNLSEKLFDNMGLIGLLSGSIKNNVRYKQLNTTGKKQQLPVTDVEKVELLNGQEKHIFTNVPVGLLFKNFSDAVDYEALIGQDYLF